MIFNGPIHDCREMSMHFADPMVQVPCCLTGWTFHHTSQTSSDRELGCYRIAHFRD